jgi:hypothetical protein
MQLFFLLAWPRLGSPAILIERSALRVCLYVLRRFRPRFSFQEDGQTCLSHVASTTGRYSTGPVLDSTAAPEEVSKKLGL